jgi:integrase
MNGLNKMARVRLKGLNTIRRRLASGQVETYYYAWRGGPRLPGKPGSPEFLAAFAAAAQTLKPKSEETLISLIRLYQKSSDFNGLAERTRQDYNKQLVKIESRFGTFPLAALSEKRARSVFLAWRDDLAIASPRQADYAWSVLTRLLSWSQKRGLIEENPCTKGGRTYRGNRAEKVWTVDDEDALMRVASPQLRLALVLALWTGQRQGDLLRLKWAQYDGQTIRLQQQKTGVRVTIPVSEVLRAALDGVRGQLTENILQNSRGVPWTQNGFSVSWRKACDLAGIDGLTFHDLRGTAVTRLAMAGATEAEIATLTGHALNDVRAILDAHYLSRDPALAKNAIAKLEAADHFTKRSTKRALSDKSKT